MPMFPLLSAAALPRGLAYRVAIIVLCVAGQWGWLLICWGVHGYDWTPPETTAVTPNLRLSPRWSIIGIHRRMEGEFMAAMKPRTGDGPMEAVKEGRLIIVRVPLEGGGRLVVSVNDAEAKELHDALAGVVAAVK